VEVQPVEERIRHGPTFSFRRSAAALTFDPAASDPPDSAASERAESPSRHRVKVVKKMEMSTWGPRWAIESVSHSESPAPAPPPEQEPEPGPGPTSPVVVQSESETRSSDTQRDSSSDTRRSSKELEDPRSRDPPMSDLDRQRRWLDSMLEDSVSYDAMAPTPNDRHGGTKDLGSTGYRYRAASVVQARVRGRRTRVRHGDAVETAVVAASARLQVDRCLKRNAQGSPIRGENQGAGSEYLRWVAGPSNTAVALAHMERKESWNAGTTTRLVATATTGSLPVGSKDPSPYPSSVEDNWSGLSDSMRNRLARAQHWRLCPSCNAVVTERSDDGSSSRRIRTGRIEQHAHAHGTEERPSHASSHRLGRRHVGAADEDRRRSEVGSAAGEQCPMDERHHVLRRHAAVPQQHVRSGVDGHHGIECARLRITVELNQDSLGHDTTPGNPSRSDGPTSSRRGHQWPRQPRDV
jgi:hypothetical protein